MMTDADEERIMDSALKMEIQCSAFNGQKRKEGTAFILLHKSTFCRYSETGFHWLVAALNMFVLATVCSLLVLIWLLFIHF